MAVVILPIMFWNEDRCWNKHCFTLTVCHCWACCRCAVLRTDTTFPRPQSCSPLRLLLGMLPDMCSRLASCLLALQKRTPCMYFTPEYFRTGLTKCRQKLNADDLLLLASSVFFSFRLGSSPCFFSHCLRSLIHIFPLFPSSLFLVSFFLIPPHVLSLPPSLSVLRFLASSPAFLSFHALTCSNVWSPFPSPLLSFTAFLSFSITPLWCTLPACLSLPYRAVWGLCSANSFAVHRLTYLQGQADRHRGREGEEIKRKREGQKNEDMKKKRCSFISKKQRARARSCGGIFHNLSPTNTTYTAVYDGPWPASGHCLLCQCTFSLI